MVKVVKQDRQFIAESVVTYQHMEDGVGNDFIRRPNGLDFLMGNEADDRFAGGGHFDTLAGENRELFSGFAIMGHDVLDGRRNDSQGMAGFDWAIHNEDSQSAGLDISGSIFSNQQISILRNRFDLVEGPSGCKLSDRLTGRDVVIGGCDHNEDSTVFTNRESIAPLARPKRT